jgi:hypothetical protein
VDDIFVFVADNIYDYALAADNLSDTDDDDNESHTTDETDTNISLSPGLSINKKRLSSNKPPLAPQR